MSGVRETFTVDAGSGAHLDGEAEDLPENAGSPPRAASSDGRCTAGLAGPAPERIGSTPFRVGGPVAPSATANH
ncbi:MAG: hypothetical protein ABEH78_09885 [Haloferacaceae archaeon]